MPVATTVLLIAGPAVALVGVLVIVFRSRLLDSLRAPRPDNPPISKAHPFVWGGALILLGVFAVVAAYLLG